MAKKKVRSQVFLECSACKRRNYYTEKNKTNKPDRLELKKFCANCRASTVHKEGK